MKPSFVIRSDEHRVGLKAGFDCLGVCMLSLGVHQQFRSRYEAFGDVDKWTFAEGRKCCRSSEIGRQAGACYSTIVETLVGSLAGKHVDDCQCLRETCINMRD